MTDPRRGGGAPARRCSTTRSPGNVALDYHFGDAEKVAAAFAAAAHVTRLSSSTTASSSAPMEPRAAVGDYDADDDRFTLHVGCQGVFGHAAARSRDVLGVPPEKVRVLTGNVGGSFGMKASVYPEYVCLLHAARALGRPVKWTDERSDSFVSDHHGRDHDARGRAGARQGRPLPRRARHGLRQSRRLSRPCRPLPSTVNIGQERASASTARR